MVDHTEKDRGGMLRLVITLLCAAMLLLAACGGNGGEAPTPTQGLGASGPTGGYATGGLETLGGTVNAFTAQWGQPAQDNGSSVSYKPQCGADNQT
jgi:hypothetical protein